MSNQAFQNIQGSLSGLQADADLSALQRRLVKMGTTVQQVSQCGLGEEAVGVILNDQASAAGEPVALPRVGDIIVCEAGAALTAGGRVMSDANGRVIDAVQGAASVGFVLTTGAASGDWVSVLFMPGLALGSPQVDGHSAGGHFRATYDVTGGDSGAIGTFASGVVLPNNAVVTRAYYYVETTFTSATDAATIAIGVNTDDAAGLKAAVAISDGSNPYDAGWHECIQDGTAAAFSEVTTAAGRSVEFVVAVEALTAGKAVLFGDYVIVD